MLRMPETAAMELVEDHEIEGEVPGPLRVTDPRWQEGGHDAIGAMGVETHGIQPVVLAQIGLDP